jgi:hypothetical protein
MADNHAHGVDAAYVAALERQNRQLRVLTKLVFALLCGIGVLAILGWRGGVQDIITAKEIRVVDDDGRTKVLLATGKTSGGMIEIKNPDGFDLLSFNALADDPFMPIIRAYDRLHEIRFNLGVGATGAGLTVYSDSFGPRNGLYLGERNDLTKTGLWVGVGPSQFEPLKAAQLSLSVSDSVVPALAMGDATGGKLTMSVRDLAGRLSFRNKDGYLLLNDPEGEIRKTQANTTVARWPAPPPPPKKGKG